MASSRGERASPPAAGDRAPPLVAEPEDGGERPSRRRAGRHARVVVFLPTGGSEASRAFVAALASRHDRLRLWGARAAVVVPPGWGIDPALGGMEHAIEVVVDEGGAIRRRWGVDPAGAALFIADRWGQVYHAEIGADVRDLARGDEIEEWLKYIATQCAECGVPDEPGHGEWSSA